ELPEPSRKALALMGATGQPVWRAGHLITALATLGHVEGLTPLLTLLETGLLYPAAEPAVSRVRDFTEILDGSGMLQTRLFAHPAVIRRARNEDLGLPVLAAERSAGANVPARQADGLDWPLRLAAVWQTAVRNGPLRLTQQQTLFKRDATRVQADEVLNSPFPDEPVPLPDKGMLALSLARAVGLLETEELELRAGRFPPEWDEGLAATLAGLWRALPLVEDWDPAHGFAAAAEAPSAFPSVAVLVFLLLAALPEDRWAAPERVAEWLAARHPAWASGSNGAVTAAGQWVAGLFGLGQSLGLAELAGDAGRPLARLSALGRHLITPPVPSSPGGGTGGWPQRPEFPQTLTVQPNAEIVAYRQGLTPRLIADLSHFAVWKSLGAACTLELQPEQVYQGLERGMSLGAVMQLLRRHGTRPVPPTVEDLLSRWSDKRERITLYTSATLLEFATAEELQEAVARGVVETRLTDRIGLVTGDQGIDWRHFRQVGNKDYEGRPGVCVRFEPDGLSFAVDVAQSDLLLEAELARLAEPVPAGPGERRYRLSPASLARAKAQGVSLIDLERWFRDRAGEALSASARLLFLAGETAAARARRELVVTFADAQTTDGVVQWPRTSAWVRERVGPASVLVDDAALEPLREALAEIGVGLTVEASPGPPPG
ncbi:MAG TPA: helicase-associated domain-containing protein, partial [Gemmataceae bacterium]